MLCILHYSGKKHGPIFASLLFFVYFLVRECEEIIPEFLENEIVIYEDCVEEFLRLNRLITLDWRINSL
ncbi:hypothetical protein HQ41_02830 [Porphyromonas sp. COT-290 OH860]|nr:hypothetical protein HQ41_02830 [Porphyromonas sp. COT-290 OH860]